MIGAKLSDQGNSRNAGRFKSTNQRLAYRGSAPRFSRRSKKKNRSKCKKQIEMWFIEDRQRVRVTPLCPNNIFLLFLYIERVCKAFERTV